jgi:hypothetical protein
MSNNLPKILAEFQSKGYVIAPAGYGKTYLIALSVHAASNRQLVLTHTFAGVNSIKEKLNYLHVPSSKYHVDTIASWSLMLCLAYPMNSGWQEENPSGKQWNTLYDSCSELLANEFIRHVVLSTYSGIYVDEYQDCSERQHSLVCSLAEFLPVRVLGDPLQAIFDFADPLVDWESSIYPYFQDLGKLTTPWRWNNSGSHELGSWLKDARQALENGQKIDLTKKLPKGVQAISVNLDDYSDRQRYNVFYSFLKESTTVIGIQSGDQKSKNKTHKLAQQLAGKFSSIEEVEGKSLISFIKKLHNARTNKGRFLIVIELSKKCFCGVDKVLTAATKRGERAVSTKKTKYPNILNGANSYLDDSSSQNLLNLIQLFRNSQETKLYRRDLYNRLVNVLSIHIDGEAGNLIDSLNVYQRIFRHSGRPILYPRLLGTTLLVKGLEYDHAIILDADSLNAKELYVAMTRGSKSLTIISRNKFLPV